jgi:6-pyruvoyltetrahydropterin/6-carboxytetrahydropterin synthase
VIIAKTFYFDSAHKLPNYEGKCRFLHGHRFRLDVVVEGHVNPLTGMVMDFSYLKEVVNSRIIQLLDHCLLNEILENPTAENLLFWIADDLKNLLPDLKRLRLYETPDSYAELEVK